MGWEKSESKTINLRIDKALSENINFRKNSVFGLPATFLDEIEFYEDAPFLKDAPYLKTLIANPNHIGCHTLGLSESYFKGTQEIERELIKIISEEILMAKKDSIDGYVCSGGTEANIQAMWIYRNFFKEELGLLNREVAIICSEDSHYSVNKGANLLDLTLRKIAVDDNRQIKVNELIGVIETLKEKRYKAIIVQLNMGTTMFGSVDNINTLLPIFKNCGLHYKIHIDGAFGGFLYPFSVPDQPMNFLHPEVNSISLDAHKMLQAPYGTGIFLARKGIIDYTQTRSATYVEGFDYTLSGSRSGANAVAVWMILKRYGKEGWIKKINQLIEMTNYLAKALEKKGFPFFRENGMNIITFQNINLPETIRKKYLLVSDGNYSKIVVMPHVTMDKINDFLKEL